jgi:hypothetical protein
LAAGSGSDEQTICDNTAVDPIIYDLVGVGSIASDAGNPTWLSATFDLAGQQLTLTGTPNISNLTQQTFEYSYTLVGNFFGCAASTSTLSGNNNHRSYRSTHPSQWIRKSNRLFR